MFSSAPSSWPHEHLERSNDEQLNYQRNEVNEAEVKQETTKIRRHIMTYTNQA